MLCQSSAFCLTNLLTKSARFPACTVGMMFLLASVGNAMFTPTLARTSNWRNTHKNNDGETGHGTPSHLG